jgi:hypothetical protein
MAFKFNPFTGTLDQTGSGGGASYIDGEVQNFSALPETIGTPAVDSAYLVREAEGTWLLARKPAGIYIRTADTGVRAADWTHAGAFPDVFNDANFLLYDNSDSTKNLAFQLSGITTGTVRTLTAPDASGTIQLTGHAAEHATGGSDAVSAFSIGAQAIFDASSNTLSGTPVALTASRARVWTLICFSSTTVTLPTTGVELGDRIVLRGGSPVSATISISSTGVSDTIQNTDEQFSYTYLSTGIGPRWIKNLVDNHDAARVNSGTFNNARINFAAPAVIGSTTPNTGAFTTLSSNVGTITASTPLAVTQTWNNSATNFRAIETNITNTTSQTESHHLACSVGGSLVAYIRRDGRIVGGGSVYGGNGLESALLPQGVAVGNAAYIGFCSNTYANDVGGDLRLFRDAADTLAQRRSTNPQVFRIYNTYTDASNHERGFMRWTSNVLQIGTEKDGTGSARALEFQTNGVTRVTISTAGTLTTTASIVAGNNVGAAGTGNFSLAGRLLIRSTANASAYFSGVGSQDSNFDLLGFGGTTSSFPALKRDTTTLQVKLADDSAFTAIQGKLTTETAYTAGAPTATGYLVLYDSAGTAYKVPAEAL